MKKFTTILVFGVLFLLTAVNFVKADPSKPTINSFSVPRTSSSSTVPVSISASSSAAITGYLLSESAEAPVLGDENWQGSAPTEYTFSSVNGTTLSAWEQKATSTQWMALTGSADGSRLAAVENGGYIYTSSDGGETWIQRTKAGSRSWKDITSSADGMKLAATAGAGYIYTSSDGGETWTQRTEAGFKNWGIITSSADGIKLVMAAPLGNIHTSNDGGETWVERIFDSNRGWKEITSSADGMKLAALASSDIYTSSDGGENWIKRPSFGLMSLDSIAYSADGSRLVVTQSQGSVYISDDGGETWLASGETRYLGPIAISGDGEVIVVGGRVDSSYMYISISTDGGDTWTTREEEGGIPWSLLFISQDGHKVMAAIKYDPHFIYMSERGNSLHAWVKDANDQISSLTTKSFATVLIDENAPAITSFTAPENSDSLVIDIEINAEDDNQVTGYMITESAEAPALDDENWSFVNPAVWILESGTPMGTRTLYAWVKDGINISTQATSTIAVDLLPVVDSFSIPASSTSLTVPVSLTASDDGSITGYMLTENADRPEADASGWLSSIPTSYTFPAVKASLPNNWNQRIVDEDAWWTSIAASNDGNKIVAASYGGNEAQDGYIYTSTNSGLDWTARTSVGRKNWTAITSSADGSKLAAAGMEPITNYGYIYTSTNSGHTWTKRTSAGNRTWTAIASSDNGDKLVATAYTLDSNNDYEEVYHLLTSTNGGKNWTERNVGASYYWTSVTSSSNGNKLAAVGYYRDPENSDLTYHLFTSTNSGSSWTERGVAESCNWTTVTSSADGNKLVALCASPDNYGDEDDGNNFVLISNNGGATWTSKLTEGTKYLTGATISDDGSRIVVGGHYEPEEGMFFSNMYISSDGGENWTEITNAGNYRWQSFASSADGNKIIVGTFLDSIHTSELGNGLYAWVKDSAGQVSSMTKSSLSAIDLSPVVMRVSSESSNLEMSRDMIFVPTTINIDDENNQATLDLSLIASSSDSMVTADIVQDMTINVSDKIKLEMFASTTISTSDPSWQATLHLPQKKDAGSINLTAKSVLKAFEIGDPDRDLIFNKAARITLFGEANKLVGYKNAAGEFFEIDTVCETDNQLTGDALPAGGDCMINIGSDLIIWTKHFSEYIIYTEGSSSPAPSNSSSLMVVSNCSDVVYDEWQDTCIAGKQFRNVLSKSPNNCSLTAAQREASERSCGESTAVETSKIDDNYQEEIKSVYNYEKSLVTSINKNLSNRLAGRILLQVEERGQAWYVEPTSNQKYFMGRAADAFSLMRNLGLGISEKDFANFEKNGVPSRLSGKIILRVKNNGEAYYINPTDLKMHYLGRPDDALRIMRELALGISNENIRQIEVAEIK